MRGGHPDPEIRGRPGLKKKFFSTLQASVWSKNEVEGRPRAPPLNPPLLSPTNSARNSIISKKQYRKRGSRFWFFHQALDVRCGLVDTLSWLSQTVFQTTLILGSLLFLVAHTYESKDKYHPTRPHCENSLHPGGLQGLYASFIDWLTDWLIDCL